MSFVFFTGDFWSVRSISPNLHPNPPHLHLVWRNPPPLHPTPHPVDLANPVWGKSNPLISTNQRSMVISVSQQPPSLITCFSQSLSLSLLSQSSSVSLTTPQCFFFYIHISNFIFYLEHFIHLSFPLLRLRFSPQWFSISDRMVQIKGVLCVVMCQSNRMSGVRALDVGLPGPPLRSLVSPAASV